MRKMLMIAAAALIAAAPAMAQSGAQQPRARDNVASGQQAQDQDASERRICVTERLSGSRMPHRVCRTAREWEVLQDGNDER